MSKKQFTAEQIVHRLSEAAVLLAKGLNTGTMRKELGVTEHTSYRWRKEYGGMRTDQAKRPKELEKQNDQLKKLAADQASDIAILKEAASENS